MDKQMTTRRRELRQKFEEILIPALSDSPQTQEAEEYAKVLAGKCADAAISVFEEGKKPKIDLAKSDPAWAILKGEQVDNSGNILAKESRDAFEIAFGFNPPWFQNKEWTDFADFVAKVYGEDKSTRTKPGNIWFDYCFWRDNPQGGKFGKAMTNVGIRKNPRMFTDTAMPTFLAASVMYPQKPAQQSFVETDDNGVPKSY